MSGVILHTHMHARTRTHTHAHAKLHGVIRQSFALSSVPVEQNGPKRITCTILKHILVIFNEGNTAPN
jgi:hypothetical protein